MNAISERPTAADVPRAIAVPAPPLAGLDRRRLMLMLRLVGGLIVLAAGAVTANWWFAEGRWIESTDNAYIQGDIAVLSPRIDGDVAAIHVTDNQFVHAGDPLITLDPRDWQARLDQANAGAAESRAAVLTAQRQVDQAHAGIAEADAQIVQAEAEAARAAADAARAATLVASAATSRQSYDLAIATTRKADAAVVNARAQRNWAEQALGVAEAQEQAAEARRHNAEAQVALARNNLDNTVLRAPFDGIASNRTAQLGQHVAPGQQLIAVAPPGRQLFVVANFKETQLRRFHPGDQAVVTPDIDPDAPITGHVDSLAPATGALFSLLPPENATGNFTKVVQRIPVKITFAPGDADRAHWLRAGLSVVAEVDTRGPGAERLGLVGSLLSALGLR